MLAVLPIVAALPMAWIIALIGVIRDRPRWLAGIMLVITSSLALLIFAPPLALSLCS
jgi:hypothetical protein